MLKLMKYELRKQINSKIIMLVVIALLEILFFYGIAADKDNTVAMAVILITLALYTMFIFLYIESIITFSKDMKTKNSYMLFMTPNSSFTILAAKIISNFIQLVVFSVIFTGVIVMDTNIILERFNSINDVVESAKQMLEIFGDINFTSLDVVLSVLGFIFEYTFFLGLAFFSITSTSTFLANKRCKGFISAVIFIASMIIISKIYNGLIAGFANNITSLAILELIYYLVFTVIIYGITSWLLEKKVSL